MRIIIGSLLFLLAVTASAGQLPWTKFYWDQGKKDALFVPLKFDKLPTTYLMQLDTGTARTVFYSVPMKQLQKMLRLSGDPGTHWHMALMLAGRHFADFSKYDDGIHIWHGLGNPIAATDKHPVIGTVGTDFFSNHIILVDFPEQRIAVLDPDAKLSRSLMARTKFIPVHFDKNHYWKIFIPVNINGESYPNDFFYDTGSSLLHIEAVKTVWQKITRRTGDERDVKKHTVMAWGSENLYGTAPITGNLRIGPVTDVKPMAQTMLHGRAQSDLSKAPYHVLGMIGNAPFYDHYMVIFDLPHKRFGIVRD